MNFKTIAPSASQKLFVKNILLFDEAQAKGLTRLPFFADGYPGLIFHDSKNGLLIEPHHKWMPRFFVYGQTIQPIELVIDGPYRLVVIQLYPFVLKTFFNLDAQSLNDACYDLANLDSPRIKNCLNTINPLHDLPSVAATLLQVLSLLFIEKQKELDAQIVACIQQIIARKGQLNISELSTQLHLTPRTLERRFLKTVGLSAKQFARIIQFQHSFEQLSLRDYQKLSDIVYSNGFADQSHFIKVFKAFTGKTPSDFKQTN